MPSRSHPHAVRARPSLAAPARGGAHRAAGSVHIARAASASASAPRRSPPPPQPSSDDAPAVGAPPAAALPAALPPARLSALRRLRPAARASRSVDRFFRLERPG
jgi:hypothetical protein